METERVGEWEEGRQKRESLLNAASIQRSLSKKFGFRNRAQKQFAQKGDLQRGTPSVKLDGGSRTETRRTRGLQKKRKGVKRSSCTRSRSRAATAAAAAAAPKFTATILERRERACGGPAMPPPRVGAAATDIISHSIYGGQGKGRRERGRESTAIHQRRVYIIGCT